VIRINSQREIEKIRQSSRIVAETLNMLEEFIQPGVRLSKLDELAEDFIRSNGAEPAFKGYRGFPASICASVNEQVVHGIPTDRALHEGDIVGIDIGVKKDGFFGDAARTYAVGRISDSMREFLTITEKSLLSGIEMAVPGKRLHDISASIQKVIEDGGFSVVREYVGHGVGVNLHEDPQIPNYGEPNSGPVLQAGMVFAIEPMANFGSSNVETADDGWTVKTTDGKHSAHFEHSVAITENGPEILSIAVA